MEQIGDVLTGLKNQQLLDPNSLQRRQTQGKYHPHRSPPDFIMATKHGLAKRVYVSKQEDTFAEEGRENCPCCGLPVEGELLPLNADLSRLYHLGSGYALYFKFLKYSIALLVLLFIITGFYNMVSDSVGSGCSQVTATDFDNVQYCLQDYVARYTIANKRNAVDALQDQQILNLVAMILIMVFFQFIRYELRKTSIVADDSTITPSDYTVKLSGLTTDVTTREIVDWIQKFGDDQNPVVVRKVSRSYDIVEFTELSRERDALADARDNEKVPEVIVTIDGQIKAVEARLQELKQKKLTYARVAYVTFERAAHAAYIESRFDKSIINSLMNSTEKLHGRRIKVKRAPEPSNVLWENLGFSRKQKQKRKHLTSLLTAASIVLSFGVLLGITILQSNLVGNGEQQSYLIRALSILASVLISTINYVLGQIIRKLTEYEKHGTYTGYFTGIARKLSVAQFINTALTTLIAKAIITNEVIIGVDPVTNDQISEQTINYYGKGGLIEGIFYVFISNAFLTPAMNIFDPFYVLKLYSRWSALRNQEDTKLDQKEAHAIFEGMPIDMSYKYALLIKTLYLTCFYAPAVPVGILFAIVGLIMVYWSDKYILLRRAALPFSLGDELSKTMIEYLEWTATLFALGNIAFIYSLRNTDNSYAFDTTSFAIAWAMLAITVIHAFLPMGAVNKRLFPLIDEVTENDTYDTARLEFYTDYDIENPITRERALKEFRNAIATGARTRDLKTGKTFEDEDVTVQRLHSAGGHGHHHHDHDEEEDVSGHSDTAFGFLENYIKTSHRNPAKVAHENKGQAVVLEAQSKGVEYDRATSYKKHAAHAQAAAYARGNTANMA